MHFADNLQDVSPRDSEQYDCVWKLRPLFSYLLKRFQEAVQWNLINQLMSTCSNWKVKVWYVSKWKISRSSGFNFWLCCGSKSWHLCNFDISWRKKENTEFAFDESAALSFMTFCTSLTLLVNLFENDRKQIPSLKSDKQAKCGKHDWQVCKTLSTTKWIHNKSVILFSNFHDPRVLKDVDREVDRSEDKVNALWKTVIYEYNHYMGEVKLTSEACFFFTSKFSLIFLILL